MPTVNFYLCISNFKVSKKDTRMTSIDGVMVSLLLTLNMLNMLINKLTRLMY